MGYFRVRRSFRVLPDLRLNLSKSGVSTSIGRCGAWFTVGPKGTRTTVGLPGTGISHTSTHSAYPVRPKFRTPLVPKRTARARDRHLRVLAALTRARRVILNARAGCRQVIAESSPATIETCIVGCPTLSVRGRAIFPRNPVQLQHVFAQVHEAKLPDHGGVGRRQVSGRCVHSGSNPGDSKKSAIPTP
jgi:hypothetical protein